MAVLLVPTDYPTIQEAINAAVGGTAGSGANIGDIIQIESGYAGPKTATVNKENLLFRVASDVTDIELTMAVGVTDLRLNSISHTSTSNVTVYGHNGANAIFGNEGANTLYGEGGPDTLDGGLGNDILYGGAGRDFLRGGLGDDYLDGGQGSNFDWADYRDASGAVTVTLTDGVNGGPTGGTSSGADGNDTLVWIDNVRGGSSNDALTGNSGSNILRGGGGADALDGGEGVDYADYRGSTQGLVVSLADPTLNTGEAAGDTYISIEGLIGSGLADTLYGDADDNRLDGAGGADVLNGGAGLDHARYDTSGVGITASLANTALNTGDAVGDVYIGIEGLQGSDFDDFLYGNSANNSLIGGDGADYLDGGAGVDVASYQTAEQDTGVIASLLDQSVNTGTAAGDTYVNIEGLVGSTYADILTGDHGSNTLEGSRGNDTLYGEGGRDNLDGGAGDDSLYGGAGRDFLRGDAGDDYLDGGQGSNFDWADYRDASGAVTVTLTDGVNGGPTGGTSSGADGNDTLVWIDNIRGGASDDVLTGNSGANVLRGGGGADTLDGGDGLDYADYRGSASALVVSLASPGLNTGEADGDTYTSIEGLIGSGHNDTLYGDAGDNRLDGAGGADTLNGGAGLDLARYDSSGVAITVSLANTALNTGDAVGDVYIDIEGLQGSDFDDFLYGNSANNSLIGGDGADYLDGGRGFDFASYRTAEQDTGVIANLANSSVNAGTAAGDVYVNIEGLVGTHYADTLTGDRSNNTLDGWRGDDTLDGGGGKDTIIGGFGRDSMTGGSGADTFRFTTVGETGVGAAADLITDFKAKSDTIDLTAIDANGNSGDGNQAFVYIGSASFGNVAGQLRYSNGYVEGDTNGDGSADFAIQLQNVTSLKASDFLL